MNKYRCQDCFRIFKSAEPKCPDCGSANVKEKKTRTQLPESESVSRPAVQPVQPELPAAEEPVQLPVLEPAPVKSGPEPVIPAEPVRPAKKPDPPRKKKKKRKPSKEEKRRKRIVAPKQKLQKPESSAIRPSELIPSAFKIDPVNLPDSPVDFNTFEDSKKEKKKTKEETFKENQDIPMQTFNPEQKPLPEIGATFNSASAPDPGATFQNEAAGTEQENKSKQSPADMTFNPAEVPAQTFAPLEQRKPEPAVKQKKKKGKPDTTYPTSRSAGTIADGFDNYEILDEISRGGMGVVFKARQRSLNRIVAIKVMLAGADASEMDIKRFVREAESCANLKHPNIIDIFDIGKHQGNFYFAMEYIEGITYDEYCRKPDITLADKLKKFLSILEAMEFAHSKKIIHRDLKPVNVMITETGIVKVMDFGLAKKLKEAEGEESLSLKTATGAVMGTPHYMSPEQANGDVKDIDERTDIFSLGVILYETVTGKRPFQGRNINEIMFSIFNNDPERPRKLVKNLDWELEAIILKALEKDRASRYPSVSGLKGDILRFIAGEPILAERISGLSLLKKKIKKHRILVTAASVLLLLLLAAGAYIVNMQMNSERGPDTVEEIALKDRIRGFQNEIWKDPVKGWETYEELSDVIRALISEFPEKPLYADMAAEVNGSQGKLYELIRLYLKGILDKAGTLIKDGRLEEGAGKIAELRAGLLKYKTAYTGEGSLDAVYKDIFVLEHDLLNRKFNRAEQTAQTDGVKALEEVKLFSEQLEHLKGKIPTADYESMLDRIKKLRRTISLDFLKKVTELDAGISRDLDKRETAGLRDDITKLEYLVARFEKQFPDEDMLKFKQKTEEYLLKIRAREMYELASRCSDEGELSKAKVVFDNLVKTFPGSPYSERALEDLVVLNSFANKIEEIQQHIRECDLSGAVKLLAELRKNVPVHKKYTEIEKQITDVRAAIRDIDTQVKQLNSDDLKPKEWEKLFVSVRDKAAAISYSPKDIAEPEKRFALLEGFRRIEELKKQNRYRDILFKLDIMSQTASMEEDRSRIGKELEYLKQQMLKPLVRDEFRGVFMALIPAQTFTMGTKELKPANALPAHQVTITRPFYMDITEVSNKSFTTLLPKFRNLFGESSLPVGGVTYNEAVEYTKRLREKTGKIYRLPTEAEWECAAKGGLNLRYSTLKLNIGSDGPKARVGFDKNPYGLYHMCGNVFEFCSDWYGPYSYTARTDPTGPADGTNKVIRGGYYKVNEDEKLEKASTYARNAIKPTGRNRGVGFRCVREIDRDVWDVIQRIESRLKD